MHEISAHKKNIFLLLFSRAVRYHNSYYILFKKNQRRICLYLTSDEYNDNSLFVVKWGIPAAMPGINVRKKCKAYAEMIGDWVHRSKYGRAKRNTPSTLCCPICQLFLCFKESRNYFKHFHDKRISHSCIKNNIKCINYVIKT